MAQQAPGFYRYRLGQFTAIALHDGELTRDLPGAFVRNADAALVSAAFAEAGMPPDRLTLTFNPLAIETGNGVVLIDTGFGDSGPPGTGQLLANLNSAGIAPEDVGTVIISHFHYDHILGLRRKDGTLTFPNAMVFGPRREAEYWLDDATLANAPEAARGNIEMARKIMGGLDFTRFDWGDEIVPGFTAVQADGHTPGMSAIDITSGGEQVLYVADLTNNPLLFARNPEWQAMFDIDPAQTIATRRRLLDQAAAERLRLHFFHAPFPSTAYIAKAGQRYEYLPALWSAT